MSSQAWTIAALRAGLAAACDRLVCPAVAVEAERARHRRLVASVLGAPLVATVPILQALGSHADIGVMLAAICVVMITSLLLILLLMTTARRRLAESAALCVATALAASLALGFGSLASPALLLAAAIPLEAYRVTRSPRAAMTAGLATAGVVAASTGLAGLLDLAPVAPSAWHWLGPLAYGAVSLCDKIGGSSANGAPDMAEERALRNHFDGALLHMSGKGDVLTASSDIRLLLGVEPEMLGGSGLFERVHVADRVGYLCALATAANDGVPQRVDLRLRVPAQHGQGAGAVHRWFRFEIAPDTEAAGRLVAIMRDGAEMADLREALASTTQRAEATEIAKGRFLATVSHELRTPLNAIIGFSEMLLHQELTGTLSPKQAEQVGMIRQAGTHLLEVVNSILDVSKIESGCYRISPEPFVLKDTVALCCAMVTPQAQAKNVSLAARVADNVGEISCDQRAVQQILLNLLSNAIKFTPHDGRIRVAACRDGELVKLRVSDNGIGIAQPDLARIGQPFMQVHNDYTRQYQGTGLGLSLVKGLVTLHGGSLSIESAPGLGTHVTVALPVKCDGAEHDGPAGWEVHAPHDNERMTTNNGAPILKIA